MKKVGLVIVAIVWVNSIFSQVSFTVIEPASIAGGYEFTSNGDAPNWGLANLLDPNDAVQDTVVIVDDGLSGINAQGIPHANEGCNTLINDLTGKIAFVYRYDGSSTNDCYAGTKVLNAQNAGAVGVIMVNRTEGVFGYDGTTDGPSTSIPFAFISKSDGEIIRAKLDAGEDVVAFIGSKLGLYDDDAGIVKNNTVAPLFSATSSKTSANASEFGFDVGTTIYNYGQNLQSNVNVTASVTGPGGIWTETAGPFSVANGDSVEVFTGGTNNIPSFSLPSYPNGTYTLSYTVSLGVADESDFDNKISYEFVLSDSIISYCNMDTTSLLPEANTYLRSVDENFATCIVYEDANASRLAAKGMYYSADVAWNSNEDLEGTITDVLLYKWNDNFIDLNDPNFAFDDLELMTSLTYSFGPNMESEMVYTPFSEPVQFEDNQRYLACVQTWDSYVTIGYSTRIDYTRNVNQFLQPLVPTSANSIFFGRGFGEERVPAISLSVLDATELAVEEFPEFNFNIYPNPTTQWLSVRSVEKGDGIISVTDLTGRLIKTIAFTSDYKKVDVSDLGRGVYFLNYTSSRGELMKKKFIKK
ncbi:MAG: PA domain-containing protein [Crocinitomicaceae bacterium]